MNISSLKHLSDREHLFGQNTVPVIENNHSTRALDGNGKQAWPILDSYGQ